MNFSILTPRITQYNLRGSNTNIIPSIPNTSYSPRRRRSKKVQVYPKPTEIKVLLFQSDGHLL